MSGQPSIEKNQLDPTIVAALNSLTSSIGSSGQYLGTDGTNLIWGTPAEAGTLYLGDGVHPSSLADVNVSIGTLISGQLLQWNGTHWVNQTVTGSGSVTSVAATGSTGLTVGGSPILVSGTLTFTLNTELQGLSGLSSVGYVYRSGAGTYTAQPITYSNVITALGFTPTSTTGTVTSVAAVGSTGLTVTGSPITSSGTLTLTLNAELTGLAGLSTTGLVARTGTGTYTPVTITGSSDITVSSGGGTSGNPTLALSSVGSAGTYNLATLTISSTGRVTAASNGTISLSNDVSGTLSGTNIVATLATINSNVGSFTNASITVDGKGRITAASSGTAPVTSVLQGTGITVTGTTTPTINNAGVLSFNTRTGAVTLTSADIVTALGYTPGSTSGTVTTVSVTSANGISGTVATATTTPAITLSLGAITPTSIAATGPISTNITVLDTTTTGPATMSSSTVIDTVSTTTIRSIKYIVQVSQGTTAYHVVEILIIQDGTTVYKTEYAEVFSSSSLGTFDAAISGSTLQLTFTPTASATYTVHVVKTLITV